MPITVVPELRARQPDYNFGSAVGKNVGQGISAGLDEYMQKQEETKKLNKQKAANTTSAMALASHAGLKGDQAKSLTDFLSNIPPEKQAAAFEQIVDTLKKQKPRNLFNNPPPKTPFAGRNIDQAPNAPANIAPQMPEEENLEPEYEQGSEEQEINQRPVIQNISDFTPEEILTDINSAKQFFLAPVRQRYEYIADMDDPEAQKKLQTLNNNFEKQLEREAKADAAKNKDKLTPEEQIKLQDIFDRDIELLNEGRLGIKLIKSNPWLNPQSAEDRAEMETLNLGLENVMKNMVGKGTMANVRFQYLKERLPDPSERDVINKGRLKAIARELGLDASKLTDEAKEEKTFETLPKAAGYKGKKFINDANGRIYQSNGTKWTEVK